MTTKHETDLRLARECVAVWKKKAELVEKGTYGALPLGAHACPLCQKYLESVAEEKDECNGCPIYEDTDKKYCHRTPYGDVVDAWNMAMRHHDTETEEARAAQAALQNAIAAEIAYLEELCAKLERPSKTQNPEQEAC